MNESYKSPSGREHRLRFLREFSSALRKARVFEHHNASMRTTIQNLYEAIHLVLEEEGQAGFQTTYNFLAINGTRLTIKLSEIGSYTYILQKLKSHQIGSIVFEANITSGDVTSLVYLLARYRSRGDDPLAELKDEVALQGIRSVRLQAPRVDEVNDIEFIKGRAIMHYFCGVETARRAMQLAGHGLPLNMRAVKRAVYQIVETAAADQFFLRCLSTLRNYNHYTYTHCANVSVLSIIFGLYLGAPKKLVGELGVGALLHDIGKIEIPQAVLNAKRPLSDKEWHCVRLHPVQGVKTLLRSSHFSDSTVRSMAVCFEHHQGLGAAGYPRPSDYGEPSLLGKIVSIADCYDALTTPRPYRPRWFTPAEAFDVMVRDIGTKFDERLLYHFIRFMGFFPTGTLVDLSTDQRAIVSSQADTLEALDRPTVRILSSGPEGASHPIEIPLASSDASLRITKIYPPPLQSGDVDEYLSLV